MNIKRRSYSLILPRKVILYEKTEAAAKAWDEALQFDKTVGGGSLKIRVVGD